MRVRTVRLTTSVASAAERPEPDRFDNAIRGQITQRGAAALITLAFAAAVFALAACSFAPGAPSTAPSNTSASAPATISDFVDHSDGLVLPVSVHTPAGADLGQARSVVHTAQVLYTFWTTGDTTFLDEVVAPDFRDNTLPPGRPQGPAGPRAASAAFRTAVPDLTCQLADLYVTGDTFTARLVFQGHFTGTYNGIRGRGQPINFNAIDIQHVGAGARITEDWHLEDNLTFLQQAGLVTIAGSK
jgi:predicted ester cyclase